MFQGHRGHGICEVVNVSHRDTWRKSPRPQELQIPGSTRLTMDIIILQLIAPPCCSPESKASLISVSSTPSKRHFFNLYSSRLRDDSRHTSDPAAASDPSRFMSGQFQTCWDTETPFRKNHLLIYSSEAMFLHPFIGCCLLKVYTTLQSKLQEIKGTTWTIHKYLVTTY